MKSEEIDSSISRAEIENRLKNAPKAQLHVHLDGSLSFDFIKTRMDDVKKSNNGKHIFEENWEPQSEEELVNWFINVAKGEQDHDLKTTKCGNWKNFDVCNQFLQTEKNLIDATSDLITRMGVEHNVNYMEIRFAPVLHTKNGLTEEEVALAVIEGFVQGKDDLKKQGKGFHGGIILCALRSFSVEFAKSTVKLIETLKSEHILGFDIAGDEGTYPLSLFEDALHLAKASGINITVHAGEWNELQHKDVCDNLKRAVELGVNRIGHGIALRSFDVEDDIFVKMKSKQISVEICLTSNCDNKSKCESFEEHPLNAFLQNKVSVAGLNVDNLMLAGNHETGLPTPTTEFIRAVFDCGIQKEMLYKIVETSYNAAFMKLPSAFVKDSLRHWREEVLPHIH